MRLGMKESQLISDMAIEQAIKEAQFAEQGRQTWLQSAQSLANLRPQFVTSTGAVGGDSGGGWADALMGLGGAITDYEGLKELEGLFGGGGGDVNPWTSQYGQALNTPGGFNLGTADIGGFSGLTSFLLFTL